MGYREEMVDTLVESTFKNYEIGTNGSIPFCWNFYRKISDSLGDSKLKNGMFMFYEHLQDGKSILAFRIPSIDAHLIFYGHRCYKKDPTRCLVSIESMKGEASWHLLEVLARDIIPFFRSANEYYSSHPTQYKSRSVIDFKSGKSKLIEIPSDLEPVMDDYKRFIISKK